MKKDYNAKYVHKRNKKKNKFNIYTLTKYYKANYAREEKQ